MQSAQTRTPWNSEEENKLLDLVKNHGISWANNKKRDEEGQQSYVSRKRLLGLYSSTGDNVLHRRTQVNMKDKAGQMKVIMLKYLCTTSPTSAFAEMRQGGIPFARRLALRAAEGGAV